MSWHCITMLVVPKLKVITMWKWFGMVILELHERGGVDCGFYQAFPGMAYCLETVLSDYFSFCFFACSFFFHIRFKVIYILLTCFLVALQRSKQRFDLFLPHIRSHPPNLSHLSSSRFIPDLFLAYLP